MKRRVILGVAVLATIVGNWALASSAEACCRNRSYSYSSYYVARPVYTAYYVPVAPVCCEPAYYQPVQPAYYAPATYGAYYAPTYAPAVYAAPYRERVRVRGDDYRYDYQRTGYNVRVRESY